MKCKQWLLAAAAAAFAASIAVFNIVWFCRPGKKAQSFGSDPKAAERQQLLANEIGEHPSNEEALEQRTGSCLHAANTSPDLLAQHAAAYASDGRLLSSSGLSDAYINEGTAPQAESLPSPQRAHVISSEAVAPPHAKQHDPSHTSLLATNVAVAAVEAPPLQQSTPANHLVHNQPIHDLASSLLGAVPGVKEEGSNMPAAIHDHAVELGDGEGAPAEAPAEAPAPAAPEPAPAPAPPAPAPLKDNSSKGASAAQSKRAGKKAAKKPQFKAGRKPAEVPAVPADAAAMAGPSQHGSRAEVEAAAAGEGPRPPAQAEAVKQPSGSPQQDLSKRIKHTSDVHAAQQAQRAQQPADTPSAQQEHAKPRNVDRQEQHPAAQQQQQQQQQQPQQQYQEHQQPPEPSLPAHKDSPTQPQDLRHQQPSSLPPVQDKHAMQGSLQQDAGDHYQQQQQQQQPPPPPELSFLAHHDPAAQQQDLYHQQPNSLPSAQDEHVMQGNLQQGGGHHHQQQQQQLGANAINQNGDAMDVEHLQQLIDSELGPPKFAVPKPDLEPSLSRGPTYLPDALGELLDREFGPPKFAVPKPPDVQGQQQQQQGKKAKRPAPAAAAKPHLRIEVMSGSAAGKVLDTTDTAHELKLGRLPDCTFSIVDSEISGKHVAISFSEQEHCWKVMDVGSLNGTTLNGMVINTEQRKPGAQHPLSDQDVLELGSTTRLKVTCSPSFSEANKRLHADTFPGAGSRSSLDAPIDPCYQTSQHLKFLTPLPEPLALQTFEQMQLHLAVHQRTGTDHKRTNRGIEDVVHWECPFAPLTHSAIFCIFDGHHGSTAATQAKQLVPATLRAKLKGHAGLVSGRPDSTQHELIKRVFLDTDGQMSMDDGCTATVVMVQRLGAETGSSDSSSSTSNNAPAANDSSSGSAGSGSADAAAVLPASGLAIQTANVGDSSVVLVNVSTGKWHKLTEDHRIAHSLSERRRLEHHGHTVKTRLYGLNISRMLGDRFLKDEKLGFIAEPYISPVAVVGPADRAFILLASDGLWDVVSEQRAAEMVLKAVVQQQDLSAAKVADLLLNQAISLRSKDDISVLVLEAYP